MMPHLPLLRILAFPIWTGTFDIEADLPGSLSLSPLFFQHHPLMIYLKVWGVFCPGEVGWDSVAWPFAAGLFWCPDNLSPAASLLPLR